MLLSLHSTDQGRPADVFRVPATPAHPEACVSPAPCSEGASESWGLQRRRKWRSNPAAYQEPGTWHWKTPARKTKETEQGFHSHSRAFSV